MLIFLNNNSYECHQFTGTQRQIRHYHIQRQSDGSFRYPTPTTQHVYRTQPIHLTDWICFSLNSESAYPIIIADCAIRQLHYHRKEEVNRQDYHPMILLRFDGSLELIRQLNILIGDTGQDGSCYFLLPNPWIDAKVKRGEWLMYEQGKPNVCWPVHKQLVYTLLMNNEITCHGQMPLGLVKYQILLSTQQRDQAQQYLAEQFSSSPQPIEDTVQ